MMMMIYLIIVFGLEVSVGKMLFLLFWVQLYFCDVIIDCLCLVLGSILCVLGQYKNQSYVL